LFGSEVVLADGRRALADEAYLTRSMMEPQADIVAGYRTTMPTYFGSLDAADAAAIVEYIRSLKDAPISPIVPLPHLEPSAVDGGTSR
jgi:cytochrome c oxidase subunit 2